MARRKAAPKRDILPDPLCGSTLLAEFINVLMCHGKKAIAEKIVYDALDKVVVSFSKDKALLDALAADDADSGDKGGEEGEGSPALKPAFGSLYDDVSVQAFALAIFESALDKVSPLVEVRSRRVGGSTYQVPVDVRPSRRKALGMRWLVKFARGRSEKTMVGRLAGEITDAIQSRGGAIRQRLEVLKAAQANAAFSHYRW